ncbi:hypothetical protein ACCO45_000673 [Purpureocillium lilacinum]|uniref:Uncharacterized protein n=1 Tax=Purpureocillium lilacinum TaxID=33203 RepID=A0ACC4E6A3_PURLI
MTSCPSTRGSDVEQVPPGRHGLGIADETLAWSDPRTVITRGFDDAVLPQGETNDSRSHATSAAIMLAWADKHLGLYANACNQLSVVLRRLSPPCIAAPPIHRSSRRAAPGSEIIRGTQLARICPTPLQASSLTYGTWRNTWHSDRLLYAMAVDVTALQGRESLRDILSIPTPHRARGRGSRNMLFLLRSNANSSHDPETC